MSTITKWDRVHSSRTVSLKSLVSGLSKLKTTGTKPTAFSEAAKQERAFFRWCP
jgi:hypothetical protein